MHNPHKRFFNCHAHCFTYNHVPDYFLSTLLPVSKLLKQKWLMNFFRKSARSGKIGGLASFIIRLIRFFDSSITTNLVLRYINFFIFGDAVDQLTAIKTMQQYYPAQTGLVMLTMDMAFMGAGIVKAPLKEQLAELSGIKNSSDYTNIVYPFLHTDPRRIQPTHLREQHIETDFTGTIFFEAAKHYWKKGTYQGVKIYPALGYYPFDKRLREVYDFALENSLPVLTHCIVGPVHFKFNLDDAERYHPFLHQSFPQAKAVDYQANFTHPLNFECLLNKHLLQTYWEEDAPDYRNLKICLAHWGGEPEWHSFKDDPWSDTSYKYKDAEYPSLDIRNWLVNPDDDNTYKNFSWFSIICDLVLKYDNVYADISYTLEDASLLNLLKITLQRDERIKKKVLFGTDYYLVSKDISERDFGINIRAELGDELFYQIAQTNAKAFLSNKFNQIDD
jgi:predicted TIM-barrel fold metal-dependent hydrolase